MGSHTGCSACGWLAHTACCRSITCRAMQAHGAQLKLHLVAHSRKGSLLLSSGELVRRGGKQVGRRQMTARSAGDGLAYAGQPHVRSSVLQKLGVLLLTTRSSRKRTISAHMISRALSPWQALGGQCQLTASACWAAYHSAWSALRRRQSTALC